MDHISKINNLIWTAYKFIQDFIHVHLICKFKDDQIKTELVLLMIKSNSITKSVFPSKWKEAKVAPLYKNGPHEDVNNYRPISILPVLSKVLEKHVHEILSNFLHHELLHKTQSGFRAQHSCETALVNMTDLWLNAIDKSKMVGVVLRLRKLLILWIIKF